MPPKVCEKTHSKGKHRHTCRHALHNHGSKVLISGGFETSVLLWTHLHCLPSAPRDKVLIAKLDSQPWPPVQKDSNHSEISVSCIFSNSFWVCVLYIVYCVPDCLFIFLCARVYYYSLRNVIRSSDRKGVKWTTAILVKSPICTDRFFD